jgi:hypothetical protein
VDFREETDEVLQAAAQPIDRPRHDKIELTARCSFVEGIEPRRLVFAFGADAVISIDMYHLPAGALRNLAQLTAASTPTANMTFPPFSLPKVGYRLSLLYGRNARNFAGPEKYCAVRPTVGRQSAQHRIYSVIHLLDDYWRPDPDPPIKVFDVLVEHADAAGRNKMPD